MAQRGINVSCAFDDGLHVRQSVCHTSKDGSLTGTPYQGRRHGSGTADQVGSAASFPLFWRAAAVLTRAELSHPRHACSPVAICKAVMAIIDKGCADMTNFPVGAVPRPMGGLTSLDSHQNGVVDILTFALKHRQLPLARHLKGSRLAELTAYDGGLHDRRYIYGRWGLSGRTFICATFLTVLFIGHTTQRQPRQLIAMGNVSVSLAMCNDSTASWE